MRVWWTVCGAAGEGLPSPTAIQGVQGLHAAREETHLNCRLLLPGYLGPLTPAQSWQLSSSLAKLLRFEIPPGLPRPMMSEG